MRGRNTLICISRNCSWFHYAKWEKGVAMERGVAMKKGVWLCDLL